MARERSRAVRFAANVEEKRADVALEVGTLRFLLNASWDRVR